MLGLTGAELRKVWGKGSFLLTCLILLVLDLFLLWYTGLPTQERAGLASYREFQREITGMSEAEKGQFLSTWKETLDGIGVVQEILSLRTLSGEMGEVLTAQAMAENPGVFEAYYEQYQSGTYLRLTDSLWQEQRLMEELYGEWEKCAGYEDYLRSVQERAHTLQNIGVFAQQEQSTFSARNIRKSAGDYARLSEGNSQYPIRWMPDKALTGAMENVWTDFLLLLSVFFFVGQVIAEEKEKGLFYVIRSTRRGMGQSMAGKLTALAVHCCAMSLLLYGANLLFFRCCIGYGDLDAAIQSVAAYRESCLPVSIREYILLSVFTKSLALAAFGALLTAVYMAADKIYLPYGAGIFLLGGSYMLYRAIPAASKGNLFKYLNPVGILKTEHFYGAYLNFDLLGYPVSRMWMTWFVIFLFLALGIGGSLYFAGKGEHLTFRNPGEPVFFLFRPHGKLLRHECYKVMVSNKAILVLLVFGFLAGYREWGQSYSLSVSEQYYQDVMLKLQGELTEEKERFVLAESERYQEAFDRIGQIDRMVSEGEISESTGEDWKQDFYAVTAFYPAFSRVWQQYQRIRTEGGNFIYDTGYLYLSGRRDLSGGMGESLLIDLFLLCCGITLAFCNAAAMENGKDIWKLIGSTRKGKKKILLSKFVVCTASGALLSLIPFLCRAFRVGSLFPMGGFLGAAQDIPFLGQLGVSCPVWGFLLLLASAQAAVTAGAAGIVFALSCWRKEPVQTCFWAAVLLVLPLAAALLGFSAAEGWSLYPLYAWAAG